MAKGFWSNFLTINDHLNISIPNIIEFLHYSNISKKYRNESMKNETRLTLRSLSLSTDQDKCTETDSYFNSAGIFFPASETHG